METKDAVMRDGSLVVREAQPSDDGEIGELLISAFVDTYRVKMPEIVVTERRKAELRDVAGKRAVATVWVAEDAGRIVGTAAAWKAGTDGSEAWLPNGATLRHVAVAQTHRGTTVAASLLAASEQWALTTGHSVMCLHVRRGALGVARFYERHGYVRDATGDLDLRPEVFLEAYAKTLRR